MPLIVIVTKKTSKRLNYVFDWLFCNRLQMSYRVATEKDMIPDGPVIYYGQKGASGIFIPKSPITTETGIANQPVTIGDWNDACTLFAHEQDAGYTLPFDLFSAIFYLLSRYEEHLPYTPDKHQRYSATDSILYKTNNLEQPLVDIWVNQLKKLLEETFGIPCPTDDFKYLPSYDIDIAWSYRHKGIKRTLGAISKDLLRGNLEEIYNRLHVLTENAADPYDCFSQLIAAHQCHGLTPLYFILCATQTTPYDKNIHPLHPSMQALIKELAGDGEIGIHPSYYSQLENGKALLAEKKILEDTLGKIVSRSRQHYLHMQLPDTYRLLIDVGITEDYTMGYGTHIGFRAGTTHPFLWYDLQNECVTELKIYPFCFMDTTARFDQKLTVYQAFEKLDSLHNTIQQTGGNLVTVFHNFSLGTEKGWDKWNEYYVSFLEKIAGKQ